MNHIEKNGEYVGVVSKMGANGEGIIKENGCTVFVPFVLIGEKVRYKVLKVKGGIAFGKATEICAPAEERVRPKCKVYEKCGGCQLQHLKYKLQLALKSRIVKDCLSKIAFIDADVPACVRSDLEYGYRNKLQLPVRATEYGVTVGFFAQNSHRIVPISDCPIQPEWCGKIISAVKKYVSEYGVSAYDEKTESGIVKHVVVRDVSGKLIITVVANGDELPESDGLIRILREQFKVFSLYLNINKRNDNVILGEKFVRLYGKNKYAARDLGVKYEVGPESFVQINDGVRRRIYQDALKYSETDENTTVIDAYSGAGMLTAIFAKKSKKAIGVEIVKEAVNIADDLKKLNGLNGVMENVCAPCEEVLPEIMAKERKENSKCVLVLDPPRQGVDGKIIEAIKASVPDRIIYISCSPQTLSRDLGLIVGTLERKGDALVKSEVASGGYEIETIKTYDMFPQTKHVETLVQLSHKTPDSHIVVKVDFDKDNSIQTDTLLKNAEPYKPAERVTYKMIQAYVEEKYGFKVHTAYIAEVKRSYGLPMYDAPNAVEKLKRPRQHPSEKMVESIKDALKNYGII